MSVSGELRLQVSGRLFPRSSPGREQFAALGSAVGFSWASTMTIGRGVGTDTLPHTNLKRRVVS
jgi:hypothetical protein